MTSTAERREHYDTFVADVLTLCADRGVRADLRTGRGRPLTQCPRLHQHLARRVAGHGAKRAHYTVASLIALTHAATGSSRHPPKPPETDHLGTASLLPAPQTATGQPAPPLHAVQPDTQESGAAQPAPRWRTRPNLGATLAIAAHRRVLNAATTPQRLHTLTRLSADLLHPRLPALADRLAAARLPLDFAVLLEDLAWWDVDRDEIATRWLEAFYLTRPTDLPEP